MRSNFMMFSVWLQTAVDELYDRDVSCLLFLSSTDDIFEITYPQLYIHFATSMGEYDKGYLEFCTKCV